MGTQIASWNLTSILLVALLGIGGESNAEVVIASGKASAAADFGCSPNQANPPSSFSLNVFYDEAILTTRPSGNLTAGGWAFASWDVSAGESARIRANGSSTAGFNGSVCSPPEGGLGWLYGRGHADFLITFTLDRAYRYSSSVSGDVSGIPPGEGVLQAGTHTVSGHSLGKGEFSLDISLSLEEPPPALTLEVENNQIWANGHEDSELTVTITDQEGHGVANRAIHVEANPAVGVVVDPAEAITDTLGQARLRVRGTETGAVMLTAVDIAEPTIAASAEIEFVQRRVVIFVQGIRSTLSDAIDQNTFQFVRQRLLALGFARPKRGNPERGLECANFSDDDADGAPNDGCPLILNFSYTGGFVGGTNGLWRSFPYECEATSQSLEFSASALRSMIRLVADANPNTRFILLGHSQGGVIALQGLRVLDEDPRVVIDALITLDGALGGTPVFETGTATKRSCWGDPAAHDLARLWKSAKDHDRQGTTARFDKKGLENAELVALAQLNGVRIMTVGNLDDCVYDPRSCYLPKTIDNSSSQFVENADEVILKYLGGNCSALVDLGCINLSHCQVLLDPTVIGAIQSFVGEPIVSP